MNTRRLSSAFLALVALVAFVASSIAQQNSTQVVIADVSATKSAASFSETKCEFVAFVNENDRNGLNVRAAPNIASKIVGKLPGTFVHEDGLVARVEVNVLATKNGWFLINGAQDSSALMDATKPRRMYKGDGWVSGRKLAVKTQARNARLEPSTAGETAFLVGNVLDGDSLSRPGQLIACKGKWVQLEYTLSKDDAELVDDIKIHPKAKVSKSPIRVQGWVNQICDIQETSCSGLRDE
jgi:hypothetical protein